MVAALRPHRLPYRTVITPVSGDQFRVQVTTSRETYDKLMHAQDLLRYALPDGDVATVDRLGRRSVTQGRRTRST
jgi:hypothetical protein